MTGPRSWIFELALGARMSVAGGRSGILRLALIAIGVGLGVAVLLGAATVPAAMSASNVRTGARAIDNQAEVPRGDDTMLTAHLGSPYRGQSIDGELLQPEGSRPPLPPGVSRIPGPGEMVVSPALARLLAQPDAALLRERWDAEVIGTIGDEGLSGPAELFLYLGTNTLSPDTAVRIREFGPPGAVAEPETVPIFVLLTLVGMVVLLIPVMVFMASAVRFGDQARDRRLAALRLVGADAAMTRRIAAGETLTGAVLGLLIGALLWAGGIVLANRYGTGGLSFYLSDMRPVPLLVAVIVIVVPAVAVTVTLSAMRRVVVEPLGVTRMSVTIRRRLWWRLILPVIGVVLLWPLYQGIDESSSGYEIQVVVGMAFLLIGIALLLPWLVEATVRRLGGGSPAWELAVRRLQSDSGTAIRAVSGIAVSVAGVIAMQGIVTGVESLYDGDGDAGPVRYGTVVMPMTELPDRDWATALAATPGVREHRVMRIVQAGDQARLRIADCDVLQQLSPEIGACRDGDVFALGGATAGKRYALGEAGVAWTAPPATRVVTGTTDEPASGETLLVTPAAFAGAAVAPDSTSFYTALDGNDPDALERLRNTAARLDPQAYLYSYDRSSVRDALAGMRDALLAGTAALLVLIGASMVVNVVEQLRERRKVLAVLAAFGTRRRTLGASVLYQVAIPVLLGMALAVTVGTALASLLMVAVEAPVTVDWFGIGATSGIAALVVLGTTAAGLPVLWRLTAAGNLRSE